MVCCGVFMKLIEKIKGFIRQSKRVMLVANKPDKEEFNQISKITLLGITILGALAFIIFIINQFIGGL